MAAPPSSVTASMIRVMRSVRILGDMDDERPPICPVCGVTMIPAELSAREIPAGDWICSECEETSEPE